MRNPYYSFVTLRLPRYKFNTTTANIKRDITRDDAFFDTLNAYYERFKGGNVTPDDFIGVAEEVSGRDLDAFFQRWFYSEELPDPEPSTDRLLDRIGVNLADFIGESFEISIDVREEAEYNNQVGFFAVDNPYGVVVDPITGSRIAPGERGYQEAALQQSVKTNEIFVDRFYSQFATARQSTICCSFNP